MRNTPEKAAVVKDASSNFAICSPASTSPQFRGTAIFPLNARQNYSEVSCAAHKTTLTFLFGILRVDFILPQTRKNTKVKPKGPREVNLNYLEIQDQYLSTFDNMLIICTPQNSRPRPAIG